MIQKFILKNFVLAIIVNIFPCDSFGRSGSFPDFKEGGTNERLSICTHPECTLAAFRVESNINYNVPPCTDFYKFVCGNFKKNKPIPQDAYMINSTSEMLEDQLKVMRHLIEKIDASSQVEPFKFVQSFYNSCINLQYKNDDTIGRFNHFLDYIGGWPVLTRNWDKQRFNLFNTFAAFYERGLSANYLFKLSVDRDPLNDSLSILTIDEPELEFPKEELLDGFLPTYKRNEYYNYMRDIARDFGADLEDISDRLNKSLTFELTLLSYMSSKEEWLRSSFSSTRVFVGGLHVNYPSINWLEIINHFMDAEVLVTVDEPVIVKSPEYLKKLNNLIRDSDVEILANYLLWKAVAESVPFLTDELRLRYLNYSAVISGQTRRKPMWRECVETTNKYFPAVTSLLFIKSPNFQLYEYLAKQILDQMKVTVDITLRKGHWIEEPYKQMLRDKMDVLSHNMGSWGSMREKDLTNYYQELIIYSDNYLGSMSNILRYNRQFFVRKFRENPSRAEDWINGLSVPFHGASFSHTKNIINFPFGILNGLNINNNLPYYTRYAGIGTIIGHEMSHAYDRKGRKFDQHGKIRNWCQLSCGKHFQKRDQCIIDQYMSSLSREANTYTIQEQSIADVEAVNIAYLAYDRWLIYLKQEAQLPCLNYTNHQMFWIWYASLHCTNSRRNAYTSLIKNGVYPDSKFRVNNPLRNSYYFASDFNCKIGDSMYLDKTQRCIAT